MEVEMADSSRREFTKKSLLLALGPVAGESAILSSPLSNALAEPQASGRDFFAGFRREQIKTTGATINVVHGGKGSPVLLMHGIPETHLLWRKVAPPLSQNFTLVITDLRGYGDSSKPPGGADHFGYSKRAMAQDQVEVMEHLGFPKFAVVGHDRGGRVAHRMALDHSDRVTRLAILDIVPTYKVLHSVTNELATANFHWWFLIQKAPLPETLIGNSAEVWLRSRFERIPPGVLSKEAFAEYLRSFTLLNSIHGSCEDYRAGATIDLVHDAADLDHKISCPVLILWGERGAWPKLYDVLEVWRERASNVTGREMPTGHFIAEEKPDMLLEELNKFLSQNG